jgi:DNA topoisomerase-1
MRVSPTAVEPIRLYDGRTMKGFAMADELAVSGCTGSAPEDARSAGLRYVEDRSPGITRQGGRDGFRYVDPNGEQIEDEKTLTRIRSLAIPPAWTDVWICRWANGHIQATGRDARGRKQYRYHPQWRSVRDEAKYGRMRNFGQALPAIREKIDAALALPGLPREKVLAVIVHLLQTTMMRIGNKEYARSNDSFGMTTLRKKHVRVDGSEIRFEFRGKSGVQHSIRLHDRRLARIIRRTRDLPGQELFQYVDDDGARHTIGSADVNDYLRELSGEDYTAKDFRTWSGTMLAAAILAEAGPVESATQAKKNVVEAIALVAKKLGNTPTICRKCYVHPGVVDAYMDGSLHAVVGTACDKLAEDDPLGRAEAIVLTLLKQMSAAAPGDAAGPTIAEPKKAKKRKTAPVSSAHTRKSTAQLAA